MKQFQISIWLIITTSAFAIAKQNILSATLEPSFIKESFKPLDRIQNIIDTTHLFVTVDSLQIGSKYLINVESNGCFHHSKLYLTISKNVNGYNATFKMKGEIDGKKISDKFKNTKLSGAQLDSLKSFEKQLIKISSHTFNCTTNETYTLVIGSKKNILNTDNCSWNGIGKLIGILFKNKN